jgi:hypothetical protein
VPIDVTTLPPLGGQPSEEGAGYWMLRLSRQLHEEPRRKRLDLLEDWYKGDPPLPGVTRNAREALQEFHRHCRTNLAALIAEAVRERQRVRGSVLRRIVIRRGMRMRGRCGGGCGCRWCRLTRCG